MSDQKKVCLRLALGSTLLLTSSMSLSTQDLSSKWAEVGVGSEGSVLRSKMKKGEGEIKFFLRGLPDKHQTRPDSLSITSLME